MEVQQLVPQDYRVSQANYKEEMYFVLTMRFETFVEHELADSRDKLLVDWSAAATTKFNKSYQPENFSNVLHDLFNFVPDATNAALTPTPALRNAPSDGHATMGKQHLSAPVSSRNRKRVRPLEVSGSEIELDNESQPKTLSAGNNDRSRGTHDGASAPLKGTLLTQMLAVMTSEPSAHHQQ